MLLVLLFVKVKSDPYGKEITSLLELPQQRNVLETISSY